MLDQVTKYANDVLSGKIIAGKLVKLACKRHLNDIEKSKSDNFQFYFNVEEAERVIKFSESLRLAEAKGKAVKLAPFQKFCLGSLMGWLEKGTDYWRYRQSNIQLARQNGKSFLNGDLATYVSNFLKVFQYQSIYMIATKKDQAKICFNEVLKFLDMDDDLRELFKITEYKSEILGLRTHNLIKALSADNKMDGLRGILNVVDEYHLHKDSSLYDMLKNGSGKLKQSITSVISTAGSNLTYPYYDMYLYCKKVLNGQIKDDRFFIFICQLDDDDDIWDKRNYIKANPLYTEDEIQLLYEDGIRAKNTSDRALTDWLTKRLNMWVADKSTQFLTLETIEKMRTDKTLEDFRGKECVIGLDLSNISDLTSISFVFKDWNDKDEEEYFIKSHSFIPNETFLRFRKRNPMWNDFIEDLTITYACNGLRLDYKRVIEYIKQTIKTFNLKPVMVAYDSNNIGGILQDIEDMKIDSIPIAQSMKNLTEPTMNFEILSKSGQVHFEESLLYEECLKNAVVVNDFGENKCCKIDKRQKDRKIDPIDATINAFKIAINMPKPKKKINFSSIYEKLKI